MCGIYRKNTIMKKNDKYWTQFKNYENVLNNIPTMHYMYALLYMYILVYSLYYNN